MDVADIKKCLEPWMKLDTWHSTHLLDQERFHKALEQCLAKSEKAIDYGRFEEPMRDLARDLLPNLTKELVEESIERFAGNAETISSYLHDIGELN